MAMGEPYSPHRRWDRYVLLPAWLAERPEISAGAKLCFAWLVRFVGHGKESQPHQRTLARAIGMGERQTRHFLAELSRAGLIHCSRGTGGRGAPNRYELLEHPWEASGREGEAPDGATTGGAPPASFRESWRGTVDSSRRLPAEAGPVEEMAAASSWEASRPTGVWRGAEGEAPSEGVGPARAGCDLRERTGRSEGDALEARADAPAGREADGRRGELRDSAAPANTSLCSGLTMPAIGSAGVSWSGSMPVSAGCGKAIELEDSGRVAVGAGSATGESRWRGVLDVAPNAAAGNAPREEECGVLPVAWHELARQEFARQEAVRREIGGRGLEPKSPVRGGTGLPDGAGRRSGLPDPAAQNIEAGGSSEVSVSVEAAGGRGSAGRLAASPAVARQVLPRTTASQAEIAARDVEKAGSPHARGNVPEELSRFSGGGRTLDSEEPRDRSLAVGGGRGSATGRTAAGDELARSGTSSSSSSSSSLSSSSSSSSSSGSSLRTLWVRLLGGEPSGRERQELAALAGQFPQLSPSAWAECVENALEDAESQGRRRASVGYLRVSVRDYAAELEVTARETAAESAAEAWAVFDAARYEARGSAFRELVVRGVEASLAVVERFRLTLRGARTPEGLIEREVDRLRRDVWGRLETEWPELVAGREGFGVRA